MLVLRHTPFALPEAREATSANTFTIKTKMRNKDGISVVETVSVCNNDTDGGIVHVGVMIGSSAYYVKSLTLTSKTLFYMVHPNLHLWPEDRVIVKIITPTSGDKIFVNVFGYCECYEEVE